MSVIRLFILLSICQISFIEEKKNEKDLIYFISIYRGKNILELGAGATGLAGLIIAATCQPNSVQITDGNSESVDYILF